MVAKNSIFVMKLITAILLIKLTKKSINTKLKLDFFHLRK